MTEITCSLQAPSPTFSQSFNQRGQVGCVEGNAGRGLAVVFDPTAALRGLSYQAVRGDDEKGRSEGGNGMS